MLALQLGIDARFPTCCPRKSSPKLMKRSTLCVTICPHDKSRLTKYHHCRPDRRIMFMAMYAVYWWLLLAGILATAFAGNYTTLVDPVLPPTSLSDAPQCRMQTNSLRQSSLATVQRLPIRQPSSIQEKHYSALPVNSANSHHRGFYRSVGISRTSIPREVNTTIHSAFLADFYLDYEVYHAFIDASCGLRRTVDYLRL
ncbi:hypothetical protein NEOLEDRAFT_805788 [Neolentinus lepideus HHB14362 ss-1]|uniref:Uncharacterized protein n=1 Tax=Neolentinus lepideus HHB14362 ss-1 TaxID=1314782 RepID=A0A165PFT5_9AGAM|nr:hypothetical protein NEOLEDRAFT_805788 [Neolentinus lepideus HHB14362 ss-1]